MAKPKHGRLDNVHAPRAPSPAVLAALAVIATVPTVVAGAPLSPTSPPVFLCPFIERDIIPPSPSVNVPPQGSPSKCDVIADKYVQGPDSLWRKTAKWTLYGSTCAFESSPNTQSQPSSTPTFTPSPNALDTAFDTSALPAGWDSATASKSSIESTTILALAIVLAGSICAFMIGCVIWRRRRKRARDIERKLAQKRGARDDPQDARGKMRMWARATARWKSNVRHSARRRRKRQCVSSAADRPLSPTLSDSPQLSLVALSTPSHRCSIMSEEPDPSRPEAALPRDGNATEPSIALHDSLRPASPPTYGASFVPLPPKSPVPNPSSVVGPDSVQRFNQPSIADDEPLPYVPPSDGHVATDDKSRLAHIRQLASSPPMNVDAASASMMQSVTAPEWHEVEDSLDDLGIRLSEVPTSPHPFAIPPAFPPLPSKADIPSPFAYLDDQPLRYADDVPPSIAASESSLGILPSAPPIEDLDLEPSAPSEDELFQYWDRGSSRVSEVPTPADLDSTPPRATESPTIPTPLRGTSFLSATAEGILPRYHP